MLCYGGVYQTDLWNKHVAFSSSASGAPESSGFPLTTVAAASSSPLTVSPHLLLRLEDHKASSSASSLPSCPLIAFLILLKIMALKTMYVLLPDLHCQPVPLPWTSDLYTQLWILHSLNLILLSPTLNLIHQQTLSIFPSKYSHFSLSSWLPPQSYSSLSSSSLSSSLAGITTVDSCLLSLLLRSCYSSAQNSYIE